MKIYALTALEAGTDLILAMIRIGVKIDGILALSPECDQTSIAGYFDPADFEKDYNIPVHYVEHYGLKNDRDRLAIENIDIDLLIVASWQRLVPDWLIDHCNHAVLGLHGSAQGITKGRGRSPQNWALISGAESFEIAVFKIDVRVDAGPVLAKRRFPYTQHDDIVTSYQKTTLLSADMLADIVSNWKDFVEKSEEQNDGSAEYLPQRKPEDGAIDWDQEAHVIRRHVAALTRPYPGAHTSLGKGKAQIWSVQPIGEFALKHQGVTGEIIHISAKRGFIVRVRNGFLMVRDYDLDDRAQACFEVGAIFGSISTAETIGNLIDRHESRYPDQVLSADIKNLVKSV